MRNFELENRYVVDLVAAMLGLITENFRVIWIEVAQDIIGITFVLQEENAEDRDEIEEIVAEFDALQEGYKNIKVEITISKEKLEYPKNARLVFARKNWNYALTD